jgi:hypothetical protein
MELILESFAILCLGVAMILALSKALITPVRSPLELITGNRDMINIYDNRKHFFSIIAELTPDHSSIVKEEIVVGNKLSDAKKTTIDGNKITNKAHIEWLKEMSRSEVSHLFRV